MFKKCVTPVLVGMILLLAACMVPEKFTAEYEIKPSGDYSFVYDGTMVNALSRMAKREAAEAARLAEAERRAEETAANAIVPGVQSRAGEHRAFDTATRHTGTILPRVYAMGVRLAPLPTLPMPGFAPARPVGPPLRIRLHSRREIRDALVAQVFLQPPKGER